MSYIDEFNLDEIDDEIIEEIERQILAMQMADEFPKELPDLGDIQPDLDIIEAEAKLQSEPKEHSKDREVLQSNPGPSPYAGIQVPQEWHLDIDGLTNWNVLHRIFLESIAMDSDSSDDD